MPDAKALTAALFRAYRAEAAAARAQAKAAQRRAQANQQVVAALRALAPIEEPVRARLRWREADAEEHEVRLTLQSAALHQAEARRAAAQAKSTQSRGALLETTPPGTSTAR